MKKKFENMMRQNNVDQKIADAYRNYSFYSAQYQRFLREILFELINYNKILSEISKEIKGKESLFNNAFFVQGIIHPKTKQMIPTKLHYFIVNFEMNARIFEKARIECSCVILDLYFQHAGSTGQLDLRSNEGSRVDLKSNPTSFILLNSKEILEEGSHPPSMNKILSESFFSFKSSTHEGRMRIIGGGSDINFSNIFCNTDRESNMGKRTSSLISHASKTMNDKNKNYFELNPLRTNSNTKKITSTTPVIRNKDYGFHSHFGTDIVRIHETPSTVLRKSNHITTFQPMKKKLFTASANKENDIAVTNSHSGQQNSEFIKLNENIDGQIKSFFKENRFYRGKLNNPSQLLKIR